MKLHPDPHYPPYRHHRWAVHLQLWNTQLEVVNLVEGEGGSEMGGGGGDSIVQTADLNE